MTDIYSAVDLSNFQFTPRCNPFNWRLLHGLDVDTLVRQNDTQKLESVVPALQQGSIDAEGVLATHNYVHLFRLLQLAVEHLWQMRESHAKLYPAYRAAGEAAENWKAAAAAYLDVGGQLLSQLQSEEGAVLTEQLLTEVAVAREGLEKADAAYNAALDKLEAEDAAARCHSLRRQRLEISWRLVFGLDLQHMLITGSVSQLEQLLPQVAYGNIMAENPTALTAAHFRQLLLLGQACLDYLHAICCSTSKVLEQQVQQLATASAPIPELTTACEDLRAALTAGLSSSISTIQSSIPPASPARTTAWHTARSAAATPVKACHTTASGAAAGVAALQSCHSPSCHHVAHLQMTGHQRSAHQASGGSGCGSCGSGSCCCCVSAQQSLCCSGSSHSHGCGRCSGRAACCCPGACAGGAAAAGGRAECSALLSGRLFDVGLTPAANRLQLRIEQLDRDLRRERESTHGMRQALEEITAMLQELPSPHHQQQQQQQAQHPRQSKHRQVSPAKAPQQRQQHTVNVPVTISMTGEGGRGPEPQPGSPGSARDPNGAVRVLINEDTIRARERSAAGQQLSEHISDIIMGHQLGPRRSPQGAAGSTAGSFHRAKAGDFASSSGMAAGPFITVRSVPSSSSGGGAQRLWKTGDYLGASMGRADGDGGGAAGADFFSGPVRGWRYSHSPTATAGAMGLHGRLSAEAVQQGSGLGLGDFMIHQLQVEQQQQQQQQQQQWPREPHPSAVAASWAGVEPRCGDQQLEEAQAAAAAAASCSGSGGPLPSPTSDPAKRAQQQLFKEAAAGGFTRLLRSMSPKRMFSPRPSSVAQADGAASAADAAAAASGKASGAAIPPGELQWPPLAPATVAGGLCEGPGSPSRSGRSFSASAAAKVAEELGAAAARRPLTPPGQFSPLKASIVAHTG